MVDKFTTNVQKSKRVDKKADKEYTYEQTRIVIPTKIGKKFKAGQKVDVTIKESKNNGN